MLPRATGTQAIGIGPDQYKLVCNTGLSGKSQKLDTPMFHRWPFLLQGEFLISLSAV